VSNSTNAPKNNPQRYEIVEPLSYSSFPLSPEQKEAAELRVPSPDIERRHRESWDDTGKKAPEVSEKYRADFIPPERAAYEATTVPSVPRDKRAIWIVHGMGQQK